MVGGRDLVIKKVSTVNKKKKKHTWGSRHIHVLSPIVVVIVIEVVVDLVATFGRVRVVVVVKVVIVVEVVV